MSDEGTQQDAQQDSDAAEKATEEKPTEAEKPDQSQEDDGDKQDEWDPERAKKKIAKLNSEAANLRKRVNEAPKADDLAAKESRIKELEPENLRLRVGYELGLPMQIALRLQGSTKEEMVADAQTLVEMIAPAKRPSQKPVEALRGGLQPDAEPEETDTRKIAERMFRS
jgi:hypothetical protein